MTLQGGYHKYKEVSFLRGFAITTVVLMHLIQVYWNRGDIPMWLRFASSLGGTGGHVFIFCSGFGLYLSYLHNPIGFGEFMKKRFIKIYLPYLLFVLGHFMLPHWFVPEDLRRRQLLSNVFLYKMFFEEYMCSFGLQLWFVSTILELYVLFIPLCKLREKYSMKTVMTISLVISAGWWTAMYLTGLDSMRIWSSFCFQYLWEFVLGMAAAEYLFRRDEVRLPVWGLPAAAVLGLGLQAAMAVRGGIVAAFNDIPGLIGYTSVVLILWQTGRRVLRPVFLWVDTISYEWFLVHVDAIMWGYYYARQITESELLRAVMATAFSLVIAWLFALVVKLLLKLLKADERKNAASC